MSSYKDFIKKAKKTWEEQVLPTLEDVSMDLNDKVTGITEEVQYQYEHKIKPH